MTQLPGSPATTRETWKEFFSMVSAWPSLSYHSHVASEPRIEHLFLLPVVLPFKYLQKIKNQKTWRECVPWGTMSIHFNTLAEHPQPQAQAASQALKPHS